VRRGDNCGEIWFQTTTINCVISPFILEGLLAAGGFSSVDRNISFYPILYIVYLKYIVHLFIELQNIILNKYKKIFENEIKTEIVYILKICFIE
jgi:hypothetical protein